MTSFHPRNVRGVTLIEVVIALAVVLIVALLLITLLPIGREKARAARCQQNLMQIGVALGEYDSVTGGLPTVPALGHTGASPLAAMLGELGLLNFAGLTRGTKPTRGQSGPPPGPRILADFTCPSDPFATASKFPAPVSYRATTGAGTDGLGGAFSPGHRVRMADVAAADGVDYTAGFAERLVGNGQSEPKPINYAVVPGPVGERGCPPAAQSAWRGDAGSNWTEPIWVSTLYNHSLLPDQDPSCIAADGLSARMGASSGHPGRIYVLLLGGSLRVVTPKIAPEIWRVMATIDDSNAPSGPALQPPASKTGPE